MSESRLVIPFICISCEHVLLKSRGVNFSNSLPSISDMGEESHLFTAPRKVLISIGILPLVDQGYFEWGLIECTSCNNLIALSVSGTKCMRGGVFPLRCSVFNIPLRKS